MSESQDFDVEQEVQETVQVPVARGECMRLTESFRIVDSRNRFAVIQKARSQAQP